MPIVDGAETVSLPRRYRLGDNLSVRIHIQNSISLTIAMLPRIICNALQRNEGRKRSPRLSRNSDHDCGTVPGRSPGALGRGQFLPLKAGEKDKR
jgi:hypothetical protein